MYKALISLDENKKSLIAYRDKGGLIYPSQMVIKICRRCEMVIKKYHGDIPKNRQRKTDLLVNKTLTSFVGETLFPDIITHQFYSEETNHIIDLSMSVMDKHISTRLAFFIKKDCHLPSVRRIYTKLIHFKNN